MSIAWVRVNGVLSPGRDAVIPAMDAGFLVGWTVFETALSIGGRIPALQLHLDRLAESCTEADISLPSEVVQEMHDVAGRVPGRARVRITLSGSGLRIVSAEPVSLERFGKPVRCARGRFCTDPYLSGAVKHGSRAGWVVAVRRAGVDDVLLVDEAGRFTEGTTCGILAVCDGEVYTAPNDGRILPSTTVSQLVELAKSLGVPVHREGASSTGPWDGLYIASATRGLVSVVELDGQSLPGAEPVGRMLHEAFARSLEASGEGSG